SSETASLAGADESRPIVVVVDEAQWLPELTAGVSDPTTSWRHNWIQFIEQRCRLDATALGTAHGTLAAFRCGLRARPADERVRLIGGASEYQLGDRVLSQSAEELARWTRWQDPRGSPVLHPEVAASSDGLRISGTGWPGIMKMFDASPG